ncbi:ferredoxin [Candidatus Woesearchaeota archaeon]|nr:ferredoxin [Candidatus Woesearchaeota archaeon]
MPTKVTIHYEKVKDLKVLEEVKELCPVQVFDKDAAGKVIVARNQDCIACHACDSNSPNGEVTVEEQ